MRISANMSGFAMMRAIACKVLADFARIASTAFFPASTAALQLRGFGFTPAATAAGGSLPSPLELAPAEELLAAGADEALELEAPTEDDEVFGAVLAEGADADDDELLLIGPEGASS